MKFRVFGDLHYSKNYQQIDQFETVRNQYFEQFFKQLFSKPADHYISIGDLTNTGHPEEVTGVTTVIRKYDQHNQFQLTVGNHDMYIPTKEHLETFFSTKLYRYFVEDELCVIFLDTTRQQHTFDWSGYMDQAQLDWLSQVLSENEDKTIIIFAHHPVYNTTMFSNQEKASVVPEVPLHDVLKKHTKKAFFICGHVHADSIVHQDNWTFVQIAAVLDQPFVREIELTSNSFTITTDGLGEDIRQVGSWLGCRMNHFKLADRGFQGDSNRHIHLEF